MEEFLVVVACSMGRGCTETASAYYESRPELKVVAAKIERKAVQVVGPTVITFVAPILVYGFQKTATLSLSPNVTVQIQNQLMSLNFKKDF